jgi:Raf kinase inhibitor-like YbhB/YbcL family protein
METEVLELNISTSAFQPDGNIDPKYTCDGEGINPPLQINNVPEGTKSLALVVEDPDAAAGTYDHWVVWNIEPTAEIEEKSNPGTSGNNSAGKTGYHPPCPPSGTHRYYFHVFALDTEIDLSPGESKAKLHQSMKGHILAKGTIMGKYQRQKNR